MNRIRHVVDRALAADLRVVLDVHHDSWQWINKLATEHDQVLARFDAAWERIATECALTPALFDTVRDGATVTLTLHFWSGATVTYRVTKPGGSVTGVVS
ncbi:cellulase family glycosylhydrolase [Streptomyces sp. NPDC058766]|uniref:cellulase family glycosylhydrolase n=1 Tax=Streptomyces sp. NPDC058766 TaxID=3346630 RepID=UPI0036A9B3AB